ncbi:hypothetical protein D3C81_07970 [compost metagenome]
MGDIFDRGIDRGVINAEVDAYLEERGFAKDTMSPTYLDGVGYSELTIDKPCFRLTTDIDNYSTLTIYINTIDVYYELSTSYGSLLKSLKMTLRDYTIEAVSELLDEIWLQAERGI